MIDKKINKIKRVYFFPNLTCNTWGLMFILTTYSIISQRHDKGNHNINIFIKTSIIVFKLYKSIK